MEFVPDTTPEPVSENRSRYALVIALVGLLIPGILVVYLARYNATWTAAEITAVAGLFTGIVGTLVGAFLGVQAAMAGQQQATLRADSATKEAAYYRAKAAAAPLVPTVPPAG